jgi:hypothetical protein
MKRIYSLSAITLLISLFIYLFYRTQKTVVNELILAFLSFETYTEVRKAITNTLILHEAIVYSLPGGLWVFCTTVLSSGLYLKLGIHRIRIVFVPLLFAVSLEFLQLMHVTNGYFDFWDIAFYVLFWLPAYFSRHSEKDEQDILSPFSLNSFMFLACFLAVYLAHVSQ